MNKGIGQPNFDRKLKMLQAPLFSLLQLIQSKDFNDNVEKSKDFVDTIELFLQTESWHLVNQLGIDQRLKGWQQLMKYKCTKNELMDVKNINLPDFNDDLDKRDYYIFAGFLKPGYH